MLQDAYCKASKFYKKVYINQHCSLYENVMLTYNGIFIFCPDLSLSPLDVSHLLPSTNPPTPEPPPTKPPGPSTCNQVTCENEGICVVDADQTPVCR